jgi:outer membrane immunogenic protein
MVTLLRFQREMSVLLETVPHMSRSDAMNRGAGTVLENEETLMKKFAILAAVAAAALMAAPVSASAQAYVGAGYTQFETDAGDIGAATGRLGYRFGPNFAVEGEASTGVDDDDGVDLNHNVGAYARGILPVTSNFDVHGRVGYTTSEVDTPLGDFEDDGIAYGAGAEYRFTPSFGLRADWTRLEGDEAEADAISLGGVLNF